jgi:HAD superfamily hydrolase (TIGR01549 family)
MPVAVVFTFYLVPMSTISAILFDAGGTLVQGAMPWWDFYALALQLTSHPMDLKNMVVAYEAAVHRMVLDRQSAVTARPGATPGLNAYLAREFGLPEARLQQALDEVLYDRPEARRMVCIDGAKEVLAELQRRGYRLAVISNWACDLPDSLALLGLADYLEAVFASESLGYSKPSNAAFLLPLDRLGLSAASTAYVGDLYDVDIWGASRVGLTPVLFDPLDLRLHPDVRSVASLWDLLDLFKAPHQRLADPPPAK